MTKKNKYAQEQSTARRYFDTWFGSKTKKNPGGEVRFLEALIKYKESTRLGWNKLALAQEFNDFIQPAVTHHLELMDA